jgi:23S rRNA G2069 N7-methylase RlmK/C1962 C5-methylase RlmI
MSGLQRSELSVVDLQKRDREERKNLNEQKERLMEEWGFQSEETKRMFEARFNKAKAKKKKTLTADEKYQRFLAIKRRGQ